MIFVDTNVFLRYLTQPTSPATREMQEISESFFVAIQNGELEVTTSEVVIHEVCYILCSKKQYGVDPIEVAAAMRAIVSWRGWTFPSGDKALYLRALEIFSEHPKLEFSDSVIAARAQAMGAQLATFDEHLGQMPFVDRWKLTGDSDE